MIGNDLFDGDATLGAMADRINGALQEVGYADRSFYSAPGGFALATQLEQIDADGKPLPVPARWSAGHVPPREFTLQRFIRALFTAPQGQYRVLVFVVSDVPFASSSKSITREGAKDWISGGVNVLPSGIAERGRNVRHRCTVLVYQFRKTGQEEPIANPDGAPRAVQQLTRTGLMSALSRGSRQ